MDFQLLEFLITAIITIILAAIGWVVNLSIKRFERKENLTLQGLTVLQESNRDLSEKVEKKEEQLAALVDVKHELELKITILEEEVRDLKEEVRELKHEKFQLRTELELLKPLR